MVAEAADTSFPRLRETLVWVYERSPYYRRVFDTVGVHPGDLRSYEEFRCKIPRTAKADLVANQAAHPPFGEFVTVGREQFGSLHTSPGPIFIPRLPEERGGTPVLAEAIDAMGVRRGDIAHITLSYHIMPGGLRLHRAFEEAGCLVINGGTGASRLQVEVARAWRATVYAGTPSFLANLGDTAREMGLDPRSDLHYRIGFSTAQTLTPSLRAELQEMFAIELFDHCGEAQIGPLAGECRYHDGMHLHARDLFCEFLDPDTAEPVGPGQEGELVATQLGPRALPLVRYAPGDLFRLLPGRCPCGSQAPRILFVGQVGAMRKIKGVLVHPAQIQACLQTVPGFVRFQVVVEQHPEERYERVHLRVGMDDVDTIPDAAGLIDAIALQIKQTVLLTMEVELVPAYAIPEDAAAPRFAETIIVQAEG